MSYFWFGLYTAGTLGARQRWYLDVFVIMDPRPECPGHAGLYGDQ